MREWLSAINDPSGFSPRWLCGFAWQQSPAWGWLHVVSSVTIFAASLLITGAIVYIVRKRSDLPIPKPWPVLAVFLLSCGIASLLDAIEVWAPASSLIKLAAAISGGASVVMLASFIPVALRIRSPEQLERQVKQRAEEIQHANRRIKENEERLRLALFAGRMGAWIWDLRTDQVELDPTEVELTGLGKRRHSVEIRQFLERVHRDDRETLERALRRCIDSGEPYSHVFRLYVPEKGYRWLQGRGSLSHDAQGLPERIVGVHFDITEHMADQEALRVRTRALEFATSGVVITSARGSDQPIVYVNPAFEELTGYELSEVAGKNCRFLQGPETDPESIEKIRLAIQREEECEVTILNYRSDGRRFWNHLRIAPVQNDDGMVTHFVGVQTDITDRVEHERRLMEAQTAAEHANRTKSEFLANMSHEIRTPLTAILGCAESLCRDLFEDEPRETARTIRSQGELLLGILNDVLDLSKIEAGKLEIHRDACSVISILSDVRSLMDPQASEKGLDLATTCATPLPETIRTDPLRFRQILLNLTSNAIKFTDRGRVELQASCRKVDGRPCIIVTVSDTGIGIPDHRLRAIFEAFTQADDAISRRVGGTGLGLTICQRLVRMLGGEISVDSRHGQGSTFTVRLPIDRDDAKSLFSVDELTQRRHQKESTESLDVLIPAKVLIAEDTKAIQFMLKRMLDPVVDDVVVVGNGAEAIDAIERESRNVSPIAVVLMDMQMPVMNGYEATQILRSKGYQLPIIALTAGAMAGERERCLEAGCTDYLAKPIARAQLIAMIATYCNSPHAKPT